MKTKMFFLYFITIILGEITIATNDVVIQHVSTRLDDNAGIDDGIAMDNSNIVIDHCSISWATDENMGIGGGSNSTLYRCIIISLLCIY